MATKQKYRTNLRLHSPLWTYMIIYVSCWRG